MNTYIRESLIAGIIYPSSSLAVVRVLLCQEEGQVTPPLYRLQGPELQFLQGATMFTNLEKCEHPISRTTFLGFIISAGNVQMEPETIKALRDWPRPETHKQLQQFLGFANFYWKLCAIRMAQLHQLTSTL